MKKRILYSENIRIKKKEKKKINYNLKKYISIKKPEKKFTIKNLKIPDELQINKN